MKTPLITLLTMGRTLDRAKDRKGAYTLRYVNKLPKFGSAARAGAAPPPPAGPFAPSAQPSLFAAPKAPAPTAPPQETAPADKSHESYKSHDSHAPLTTDPPPQPSPSRPPPAPRAGSRWLARLLALLAAAVAVVPTTAGRIRSRWRSPATDSRPRAQAELALDKVTVLRNDLSDADLVVVAAQPKSGDSRAPEALEREPVGNPWTRVTARWIKLKSPAPAAPAAQAGSPANREQTPC